MRYTSSKAAQAFGPQFGGFAEVARRLTDAGPRAVSRQGVRAWVLRSERNGFPAPHHLDEEGYRQWDLNEVLRWYEQYVPPPFAHWGRGGGKRKEWARDLSPRIRT